MVEISSLHLRPALRCVKHKYSAYQLTNFDIGTEEWKSNINIYVYGYIYIYIHTHTHIYIYIYI